MRTSPFRSFAASLVLGLGLLSSTAAAVAVAAAPATPTEHGGAELASRGMPLTKETLRVEECLTKDGYKPMCCRHGWGLHHHQCTDPWSKINKQTKEIEYECSPDFNHGYCCESQVVQMGKKRGQWECPIKLVFPWVYDDLEGEYNLAV